MNPVVVAIPSGRLLSFLVAPTDVGAARVRVAE